MSTPIQSVPLINGVPAGTILTAAEILAAGGVVASGSLDLRNRLLNGDMRIDQANAGAAIAVNLAAQFRSVDKFSGFGTTVAGSFTLQQLAATPPTGFTNYLRVTVTTAAAAPAAGDRYFCETKVEGLYIQDLPFGIAGNTQFITISFQVRSSLIGTFSASIRNSAGNRSYPFTFAITAANTWTSVTVVIPVDTAGVWLFTTAVGISLVFDLGSGANALGVANAWAGVNNTGVTGSTSLMATNGATLDFTGLQLEPGTVATTFAQVAFPDMLQRCQREFCKSFSLAVAPVQNAGINTGETTFAAGRPGALTSFIGIVFPTVMRAVPTIVPFNPAAANIQIRDNVAAGDFTATNFNNVTERGAVIFGTGNAATVSGNDLHIHWTADARL